MEFDLGSTALPRRLAQVCALVGGGAALAAGVGWMFGQWRFAAFGADYIPMAPSTAWLIFLLSVALFLLAGWPARRLSRTVGIFAATFVTSICVLLAVLRGLGIDFPVERWLAPTTVQIGDTITGRMSPLTAVGLLLTSAAVLFALPPLGQRRLATQTVTALAAAVLLIGLAVMLGYASGLPLLYGSGTIPMALLTAVAFALLGTGLLALSFGQDWWRAIAGRPAAGSTRSSRRFESGLLAALAFLIGAIGVVGSVYLRRQVADWRTRTQNELSAVADLKAGQVGRWLHERQADAETILRNRALIAQLQQLLAHPADDAVRQDVRVWMEAFRQYHGYERIQLCDAQAAEILSVPPAPARDDFHRAEGVRTALRSPTVVFSDLHREAVDLHVHLGCLIPIGVQAEPDAPADGVLILRADARDFLYPLIQSWPVQSRTAETLLVRRDGEEVLFLNELRHRTNTALSLREPLNAPHLPAAAAARGEVVVREGVDYRGVPVLAVPRAVPDSPWFLVAKVDREEILAPLRRQAWATSVVLALLVGLVALAVVLLWRRRSADFLLAELTSERERKLLAERIGYLSKHAHDIMLFTDRDWRILDANDRAVAAYGYTLDELMRLTLPDLGVPEDRDAFDQQVRQMDAQNGIIVEVTHQRKDGSTFLVESSMWSVILDGQRFRQAILRDITQRRAQEREIERLTRLYATLSQINQSIVRVRSHDELFREICRVTTEFGGFRAVWVGRRDPETQQIVPVARAGDDKGYLDRIKVYADVRPEGMGPVGTCIREDRPCVFNDFPNDPKSLPWRAAARANGILAVAAMPIHFQGQVWGAFTVYDAEANVFQDKEVELLEEAAQDISHAMESLELERQRQAAELALRESKLQWERTFDAVPDLIALIDRDHRIVRMNRAMAARLGSDPEQALGRHCYETVHGLAAPPDFCPHAKLLGSGSEERADVVEQRLGGIFDVTTTPLRDEAGQVVGSVHVARDVTERKRAEQEREVTVRLLGLLNASNDMHALMRDVTLLLREWSGCDAVGIRLRDGDDFPYFETRGFPQDFILAENQLCVRDSAGLPVRDSAGDPVLECMCGNVLCGRFDAARPFFTARGSFWTNGTSELLAGTCEADRQIRTRNRCNGEGYESVALVALRVGATTYGLLQVNDKRRGRFTPERITLLERLADSLAVAIAHRQSALQLRESVSRYRLLADNAQDFVLLNDVDGRRLYVSPSFYRATGWTPQEFESANWRAWIHPDDLALVEQTRAANLAGETTQIEYRMACKDGSWLWVETRCTPIADADGRVQQMQLCARDVNHRKRAEAEILHLNAELEQRVQARTAELQSANHELEAFSYSVSHDLRAPLRAVNGYASILREEFAEQLDSEGRRLLHSVISESTRMGRLIDDLLAFSRLGRQSLQRSLIDMESVAGTVFAELAEREPGRMLRLSLEPIPPAWGDLAMMRQVWVNLLSNAIKYTSTREVAEIAVQCRAEGEQIAYCVQDNGVGFDMKYAGKLFGVFQRLHGASEFDGTGVGLALVRRILLRHGGRVWANAEIDAGATFSFTLPLDRDAD
jgi:PAS domain S-box-containing protein